MKANLILFILILWGLSPGAKAIALNAPAKMARQDSLVQLDVILPEKNGELILDANRGRGVGPNIKYMPEWKAFGFFREGNHIEWKIRIDKTKKYKVYLEWSAEGGVVGNPYVIQFGKSSLEGKIIDSGSWETFMEEPIGVLKLKKGEQLVVFRPGKNIEKGGGMLDVKTIRLVPE